MFGIVGGLIEFKVFFFVFYGFVIFFFVYFVYDDFLKYLFYCEFEYFEEVVNWFVKYFAVMSYGIGVMGVLKGSEIILMMVVYGNDIIKVIVLIFFLFVIIVLLFKISG